MVWPAAIADGWHPVAGLDELTAHKPLARMLMGRRLVVFRGSDGVAVFNDRCPHRGAPLSRGLLRDGTIECPYHGWRFAADGRCVEVPGSRECPTVTASTVAVKLAAGLVWISLAKIPPPFPALPESLSDDSLDRFWWRLAPSKAGLLDALENHLDPAHPHHIHPWLVRAPQRRKPVSVEVRSGPWGAEAIYTEDRRNDALLSSVMEGRRARSIGRLWPPNIGEVRLEAASGAMLSIAVVFAPVDGGLTRPWAHFATTRGRLPAWFKQMGLKAFHWPVLRQDRRMLRWQEEARTDQGYVMGPLDVLSRAIWRHANGEACAEEQRTLELLL